jgi:hypothetical protein
MDCSMRMCGVRNEQSLSDMAHFKLEDVMSFIDDHYVKS